jgi:hypothetical protein
MKPHLAEFLKRRPPHAAGRMTEAWDGGKQPGSWFAAVDGRGRGEWREYVIAKDISTEINWGHCAGCFCRVSPSQGPEAEDPTLRAVHTVWENRATFEAWTKSEAFRAWVSEPQVFNRSPGS